MTCGHGRVWAVSLAGFVPSTTAAYASVAADGMGDAATLVNVVQRPGGTVGAVAVVVPTRAGPGAHMPAFGLLALVSAPTPVTSASLRRSAR